MDIIIPNKAVQAEGETKEERTAEKESRSSRLVQGEASGLKVWVPEHTLRGELLPQEKIRQEKQDSVVTQKADVRSTTCWQDGCSHSPRVWVREVQFDLFKPGTPITLSGVSTDYSGPIPGFCIAHETRGIELLTDLIYKSRKEMQWGYRPSRAVILFTDGSKTELDCIAIEPKTLPTITDTLTKADGTIL